MLLVILKLFASTIIHSFTSAKFSAPMEPDPSIKKIISRRLESSKKPFICKHQQTTLLCIINLWKFQLLFLTSYAKLNNVKTLTSVFPLAKEKSRRRGKGKGRKDDGCLAQTKFNLNHNHFGYLLLAFHFT